MIKLPLVTNDNQNELQIITIEGCNGVGKSTLLNNFKKKHLDYECMLSVPDVFQTSADMKKFMLFDSSPLCNALYYLSGSVEVRNRYNAKSKKIILDRSIWSTFATAYAKEASIIEPLFKCLESIRNHVFIPNKIIILEASYETCLLRINEKSDGKEFDKDQIYEFDKKNNFYKHLKNAGYDVTFINTDSFNQIEVLEIFKKIIIL
jgi:thymidylate kinase